MVLAQFSTMEIAVSVAAMASAVVGLYVGYQALRGLRRNQSRPMRYLSVGLILLTAVTYTVAFLGTMLFRLRVLELPLQDWFRLLVRLLQLTGLVLIAYSLYVRRE
jgi:ABC-type antimicrobial peptide transport system permease subunit